MEENGAKEGDTQVCAFMGISTSDREMSQLNLDGKVRHMCCVCVFSSLFYESVSFCSVQSSLVYCIIEL